MPLDSTFQRSMVGSEGDSEGVVVVRVEGVRVAVSPVAATEAEATVVVVVRGELEHSAEAAKELVGVGVKAQVNSAVEMVGAKEEVATMVEEAVAAAVSEEEDKEEEGLGTVQARSVERAEEWVVMGREEAMVVTVGAEAAKETETEEVRVAAVVAVEMAAEGEAEEAEEAEEAVVGPRLYLVDTPVEVVVKIVHRNRCSRFHIDRYIGRLTLSTDLLHLPAPPAMLGACFPTLRRGTT